MRQRFFLRRIRNIKEVFTIIIMDRRTGCSIKTFDGHSDLYPEIRRVLWRLNTMDRDFVGAGQ